MKTLARAKSAIHNKTGERTCGEEAIETVRRALRADSKPYRETELHLAAVQRRVGLAE